MTNNENFKIRTYGRTELAQMYCPELTPNAAWKKLKRWIKECKGLTERLWELGYNPKHRSFTPAQVKAIIDYLDEP